MRKVCSGKYYSAFFRQRGDSKKSQLIIIRRDTKEIESVVTVSTDKLREIADELIVKQGRPLGWKAPHRACLYYCVKVLRKREDFGLRLLSGKLGPREVMDAVKRFEAFQYYLVRKVNSLSGRERLLLLTPSRSECKLESTEAVDLLQARESLFWLFFERSAEMTAIHSKVKSIIDNLVAD